MNCDRKQYDERKRDAFAAKYKLVGAQEELTQLQESIRLLGEERDALKTSLKEEEVARVAAQGGIALPVSNEDDDLSSPRKAKPRTPPQLQDEMYRDREMMTSLKDELRWTRRRMRVAEEQVEHMKIECQFQCCSCRLAEQQGTRYEHDTTSEEAVAKKMREMEQVLAVELQAPDTNQTETERPVAELEDARPDIDNAEESLVQPPQTPPHQAEVAFCTDTGTFKLVSPFKEEVKGLPVPLDVPQPLDPISDELLSPPSQPILRQTSVPAEASLISLLTAPHLLPPSHPDPPSDVQSPPPVHIAIPLPEAPTPPPHSPIHRTITTTTIIPLAGEAADIASAASWSSTETRHMVNGHEKNGGSQRHSQEAGRQFPFSPATMTREEAIEQIRLRRGRARSIAAGAFTPRKQMVEGIEAVTRRDISAPAMRNHGVADDDLMMF